MTPKNKANTSIVVTGAFLFAFMTFSCDTQAEQTITITIPADATIRDVESSYCEPIYNEPTNEVWIPRCWKLKQQPSPPNALERLFGRAVKGAGTTIENQLGNGIDRQIYDMGQNIRDVLGTDK